MKKGRSIILLWTLVGGFLNEKKEISHIVMEFSGFFLFFKLKKGDLSYCHEDAKADLYAQGFPKRPLITMLT